MDIMYKSVINIYNTDTEDIYVCCTANDTFILQQ